MRPPRQRLLPDFLRAPHHAGALLLLVLSFFVVACDDQEKTADWDKAPKEVAPAPAPVPVAPTPTPDAPAPPPETTAPLVDAPETPETAPDAEPPIEPVPAEDLGPPTKLRFVAYNLKNYLTMERYVDGKRTGRPKPEKEKAAIVKILAGAQPDVLGICEIGSKEDLADLQQRLAAAGVDLPHFEHSGGADDTRHLALLSRFPITATNSQHELTYNSIDQEKKEHEFIMRRGILDATVQAGEKSFRFLGVHLKSKREIPDGYQDLIRRNEAFLLRKHADGILKSDPETLLCVYGDFNDVRRSTPVRSIQGPYKTPLYLEDLFLRDSRREVWTHYWEYEQTYSRFDYILVNPALRSLANFKACRIIDDPEWFQASDHRALLGVFEW